jgi:hypothetical protein
MKDGMGTASSMHEHVKYFQNFIREARKKMLVGRIIISLNQLVWKASMFALRPLDCFASQLVD